MASTNIQTFPGKVGVSNTNPIHTLDIGSNVYIDDAADTKVRVMGNIHASGITVDGNITVIETDNLSVKDPVLLLASGSTGTSDTGIIMKRADGDANVAVFYDEGVGLKICHTMSSGDEIHLTADTANALATSVYGPVTIENTGVQSLSVSGGAQINKTLQIGTIANLYVDTTTSNVGIGTNAPAYKLDVHGESNVGVLTASTISVAGTTPTGSNVLEINGTANAVAYWGDGSNLTSVAMDSDLQSNVTILRDEIDSNLATARTDLQSNVTILRGEIDSNLATARTDLQSNVTILRDEIDSNLATARTDLQSNVTILRGEIDSNLATARTDLQSNVTILRDEIDSNLATARTDLQSNVTILRGEIDSNLATARTDLQSNVTILRGEIDSNLATARTDLQSNVTILRGEIDSNLATARTDLQSNVTILRGEIDSNLATARTDLQSNVTILRGEIDSNLATARTDLQSNVTILRDTAITFTGTKTFEDDVVLESNLRVKGDLLVANTVNMTVSDPILELGSNNLNTGDVGIVMTRHGASNSNVAVFFDETADTLKLGYTLNGANDTTLEFDSNALAVSVQGALTASTGTFSGDFEVGTANMFVDTTAGNVGIGTTSPATLCDLSLASGTDYSNTVALTIRNYSSDYTQIANGFGSRIHFRTNRGTTGGSTSPSADIKGYVYSGAGGTGDYHALDLDVYGDNGSLNKGISILSTSYSGGPANTIMHGNVGIGTADPNALLHIEQTLDPILRIQGTASDSNAYIELRETTGDSYGASLYYEGTSAVQGLRFGHFNGSSTLRTDMAIDRSTGRVGIGTTTPQGLLHLSSGTSGDAHLIIEADTDNNNEADNPKIVFRQDGGFYTGELGLDSNRMVFRSKSSTVDNTGFVFYSNVFPTFHSAQNNLDDLEDTQVEVMRIQGNGNVGIGTDSPSYKLDVHGTANVGTLTTTSVSGDGSGLTSLNATNISTGTLGIPISTTTGTFSGDVEVTGELTTKSNVFLGVMSTHEKEGTLEFGRADGTDRVHNIKVYNSSTQASNYMKFQIHAGGASAGTVTDNVLYLRGDGNVGIGTASPARPLTIESSSFDGIRVKRTTAGGGSAMEFINGDGDEWTIGAGGTGTFGIYDGATFGEQFTIDTSGNVGIGTNSPSGKLHIYQSGGGSNMIDKRTNISTADFRQTLNYTHYSSVAQGATRNPDNSRGLWLGNFVDENDGAPSGANFMAFTNSFQFYAVADQEKYADGLSFTSNTDTLKHSGGNFVKVMHINANGNVGIGTTSPGYKLDVNGTVNTGALTATTGTFSSSVSTPYINGHGYVAERSYTFNPTTSTTKRFLGWTTEDSMQIAIRDSGWGHGGTLYATVYFQWGNVPNIVIHKQSGDYTFYYTYKDDRVYLWFNNAGYSNNNNVNHYIRMRTTAGAINTTEPGSTETYGGTTIGSSAAVSFGTVRLCTTKDGNVGIGTTNPSTKLDVNGGMYASGSIVQVQSLNTTSNYSTTGAATSGTISATYNTGIKLSITPKKSTSKILVNFNFLMYFYGQTSVNGGRCQIFRKIDSANRTLVYGANGHNLHYYTATPGSDHIYINISFVDTPNTTGVCEYELASMLYASDGNLQIGNNSNQPVTIQLMEIGV
jgi:hypothetical protein